MRRAFVAFALGALVLAIAASGHRALADQTPPLVGADFFDYTGGNLPYCYGGGSFPGDYGRPGVRAQTKDELAAMRAAGLQTLRFMFAYHYDETGSDWDWMPSTSTGRLEEPFRTNLINFVSDIRAAGFDRLTLNFDPRGDVNPFQPNYAASSFEGNWSFIRDATALALQYGPTSTHVDLFNEGAPDSYVSSQVLPSQVQNYITRMYSRYVEAFGPANVTISSVGADLGRVATRIQNLIDALRASGKPLPGWFDVHPPGSHDGTLAVLRAVDATLTANGLSQPLVIGEEQYNDAPVAAAIAEFMRTSSRPVAEVMEWPALLLGSAAQPSCPSPPYRVDAYAIALQGSAAPLTLTATVGPRRSIAVTTTFGNRATALEAGTYQLVVRDMSAKDNFHFSGPGVNVRTGLAQRGTRTFTVTLSGGAGYYYRSDRRGTTLMGRLNVLTPG